MHTNINLMVTKFYVDILQIFTSYATGTCSKLMASLFHVILQMFKRSQSIEYSPTFLCWNVPSSTCLFFKIRLKHLQCPVRLTSLVTT